MVVLVKDEKGAPKFCDKYGRWVEDIMVLWNRNAIDG